MSEFPTLGAVKRKPLRALWEIYPGLPLAATPEHQKILEAIESRIFETPESEAAYIAWRHESKPESQPTPQVIKAIRLGLGWSQERFAIELDISRATLAMVETGRRKLSFKALAALNCHKDRQGYRPPSICDNKNPCFTGSDEAKNRGAKTLVTAKKRAAA